jgi:hypothetical protein
MKDHLSAIIIALAIVLAAIICGMTNRYVPCGTHDTVYVIDKWTGKQK